MSKVIEQMFFEYLPANELIGVLKLHQRDLVLRAMRKQVTLYYPVKSEKYVTYYPIAKTSSFINRIWLMIVRTFLMLSIGLDNRNYTTGQIIQIRGIDSLNALALNALNESLIFAVDFDSESELGSFERYRNKFQPVSFNDVLVHIDDALALRQLILDEEAEIATENKTSVDQDSLIKPTTKQAQREEVFLSWLADKDELVVSNMKKDDVWAELRNIDPHLFVSEPKTFFRVQQIITFKSGRKAIQED